MGNYFSISTSETNESIKIINEFDHVHVIASDSEVKDVNHENKIAPNDFLNEQTKIQTETKSNVVDVQEKQVAPRVSSELPGCIVYKKKNIKKKKCKKNKKHLQ
jgi:hypothetical protein